MTNTQTHNNTPAHTSVNQAVVANFSKQANFYDQAAQVQQLAAQRLNNLILERSTSLASGSVLEIGCGTGLLSKYLLTEFSDRQIYLLDPAKNMLRRCQHNLSNEFGFTPEPPPNPPKFIESSIESFLANPQYSQTKLALIASSFTFQWLADLELIIKQLINRLKLGGQLYFSYPTIGSFPEWQASCHELALPFTANQAPGFVTINSLIDNNKATIYCEEYFYKVSFPNSLQFFREMKQIGAHTKLPKYLFSAIEDNSLATPLTVSDLRRLTQTWNRQASQNQWLKLVTNTNHQSITCTYKIIEGIITVHR